MRIDWSIKRPFCKGFGRHMIDISLAVRFLKFPSKIINNSNGLLKKFQPQKLYGSANAAHLRLARRMFLVCIKKAVPGIPNDLIGLNENTSYGLNKDNLVKDQKKCIYRASKNLTGHHWNTAGAFPNFPL